MDYSQLAKNDLFEIAKGNNIRNYSKLNKNGIISLIEDIKNITISDNIKEKLKKNIEATSKRIAKKEAKKEKGPPKPKSERLDKKLAKSVNLEQFKDKLKDLVDPTDEDLLNLVSDETDKFTDTISQEDHVKYVNHYGPIKLLLEYSLKNKLILTKLTEDQLYENLSLYLYENDKNLHVALLEKMRKYIEKIKKESEKQAKPVDKKSSKASSSKPKKNTGETKEEAMSDGDGF